jgi:hypothetical protein
MPEAASSAEFHLGTGSRHLWNVRPETTQKGFLNETLKISENLHISMSLLDVVKIG